MSNEAFIPVAVLSFAFIANILLGALVLFQSPKSRLHQFFFLFTISASLWILTNLLFAQLAHEFKYGLALISYASASSLALFFLLYSVELSKSWLRMKEMSILLVGVAFTIFSILPEILASDVSPSGVILTNKFQLFLYGAYLAIYMIVGVGLLIRASLKSNDQREKQKLMTVVVGLSIAAVVGLFFNLVLPIFGNYDFVKFGPVASLVFVGTSTYAIVKHGLFDIKLAAVRSIAYVLALGVLASIYYFMAYIVSVTLFRTETTTSVSVSPANIFLALILAFMFQPIKRFFDRLTDSIFYRDMYKTDDFFARISELLGSTTDLRGLLERSATEIGATLKAEQVYFFLYYNNAIQHHMSAGTQHHTKMPIQDARLLDEYVDSHSRDIIITDMMAGDNGVRRMLVSHRIALVMPLWYSGGLLGYVLLGEQQRSGGYNKRDLKVLMTLADELVIAIQNALSIHAVKEINAHLQQRIDVATKELRSSNAQLRHMDETKDEFMSMASHQLRTPLTSVKGYISMVLEGDVGKISQQQRVLLEEAFNSSERMVRLIADFLNVSRLQTGKFIIEKNPTDIVSVVRGEVESLQLIAKTHNRKLQFVSKEKELMVLCDEAKVRQVIMNFIDNAIYYTRQVGTIKVTIEKEDNNAVLKVIDAGIGVPAAEQQYLFTKFFRAKNARQQRPDGTGVGLFLAKKVIVAHGGKMIFESTEGVGSTFGFYLPVGNLSAARQPDNLEH